MRVAARLRPHTSPATPVQRRCETTCIYPCNRLSRIHLHILFILQRRKLHRGGSTVDYCAVEEDEDLRSVQSLISSITLPSVLDHIQPKTTNVINTSAPPPPTPVGEDIRIAFTLNMQLSDMQLSHVIDRKSFTAKYMPGIRNFQESYPTYSVIHLFIFAGNHTPNPAFHAKNAFLVLYKGDWVPHQNYSLIYTPPRGNCVFHACVVAKLVDRTMAMNPITHVELRAKASEFLIGNPLSVYNGNTLIEVFRQLAGTDVLADFPSVVDENSKEYSQLLGHYLERCVDLATERVWGDVLVLVAIANVLKSNIKVLVVSTTGVGRSCVEDINLGFETSIILLYDKNHYYACVDNVHFSDYWAFDIVGKTY